jgi:outer membrane lipopolysaccharide assembly protein LptE/RlpB
MRRFLPLALCVISLLLAGCAGYEFQGTRNPLKDLGVHSIYVEQFRNQSFRPGLEQLFSVAMTQEIQKSGSFRLADSKETADAVLTGTISGADSNITSVRNLTVGTKSLDVAAEFSAVVQCEVQLKDKDGRTIFTQSIAGNKVHPGATDTGVRGSTVPLINESSQRLAVQFIAAQMMASVYQRMIDTF